MSKFITKIFDVKNIRTLEFEVPITKGLYAITGENGSGKSTIVSSIATSFYRVPYTDYFGKPREGSYIEHRLDGKKRIIKSKGEDWEQPNINLGIIGFFEGSIVYGNRFKDIDYDLVSKLSNVEKKDLTEAEKFITENLGAILHDNVNFYQGKLFSLKRKSTKNYNLILKKRKLFYYENQGSLVSQLQMSAGENLLLTILESIQRRLSRPNTGRFPTYILLDEIELALHSSAIRRFVFFLSQLSENYNFSVIFSTHSIEILRGIEPDNIYYVQNSFDGEINLINPCYPVYATRNLESANYGYDFIVMVEDDLGKKIVEKILLTNKLLTNKKVLVIPVGGWNQVLRFAYDTIKSNLTLSSTKILIILDRDVQSEVNSFMRKEKIGFEIPPHFLPIESLEKYLLKNLVESVDFNLMNGLTDYIFHRVSVESLVKDYNAKISSGFYRNSPSDLKNGKSFYKLLKSELKETRKPEKDLVDFIIDYLFDNKNNHLQDLTEFLKMEIK